MIFCAHFRHEDTGSPTTLVRETLNLEGFYLVLFYS